MPIPKLNKDILDEMKNMLQQKTYTVHELANFFKVSTITIYRYFRIIDKTKTLVRVGIKRPTQYATKCK
jgi:DeoR/GlpR family transcriptional regulator of sugar metabolism